MEMQSVRLAVFGAILLCLGIAAAPGIAHAQLRVRVALVDSLSEPNARAEVVRFGDISEPTLILLKRESARTEDLAAAIELVKRQARNGRALRPGTVSRSTISGHSAIEGSPRIELKEAAQMLSEVRKRPASRVGNLGRGSWGEYVLTP